MDIIVLCINQEKSITKIYDDFYIEEIYNQGQKKEYCSDEFALCNSINGSLYSVYSKEAYYNNDIVGGTFDIIDTLEKINEQAILLLMNQITIL